MTTENRNTELQAIADALGGSWHIFDRVDFRGNLAPQGLCDDDGNSLWFHFDREYIEVSPNAYPEYTTEDGRTVRVGCRDLYPDISEPRTRARRDRPAAQIARQIQSKVLEPWAPIHARLQSVADARDKYAKDKNGLARSVAMACSEPYREGRTVFYPKTETPIRTTIEGADSVNFNNVPGDLALKVLALINQEHSS
jgi:hypothetical protein